jgi:hypothetical protein
MIVTTSPFIAHHTSLTRFFTTGTGNLSSIANQRIGEGKMIDQMTDDVKQYGCVLCDSAIPISITFWMCMRYSKSLDRAEDGKIMPCGECKEGKK